MVLWLVVGEAVTVMAEGLLTRARASGLAERVLLVYCLGLFVSQVLPLDLTLNLGELAQKYRNGRSSCSRSGTATRPLFDQFWDVFCRHHAQRADSAPRRSCSGPTNDAVQPLPLSLGIASVALIEFCQVFVISRVAAVTDVLTGSIGVLLGVGVATALLKPSSATAPRRTCQWYRNPCAVWRRRLGR